MQSTKKKAVEKDDMIYAQGKMWSRKSYMHFRQYQTEFNKKRYRMYGIRMLNEADSDLIKWLDSQENLNLYLKDLIAKDMKKKKSKKINNTKTL